MFIVNCKSRTVSMNGNDMVSRYFSDIRKYKQLTEEEERELLFKVKNGTPQESRAARDKLIQCNQRLVASVAKHLSNADDFNDLVSEGTIGLDRAIDKFNLDYKQHFITYAVFWINKYMVDYLIGEANLIVPKNANRVYAYVAKANNDFFLKHCRYPSPEELQEILKERGVVFANKDDLVQPVMISSDEIDPEYSDTGKEEVFKLTLTHELDMATCTNNVEDKIHEDHFKVLAMSFLDMLNDKQRYIVTHYHGIGCDAEPFQMIAGRLNTATRNVSREYKSAINKIRKKLGLQITDEK